MFQSGSIDLSRPLTIEFTFLEKTNMSYGVKVNGSVRETKLPTKSEEKDSAYIEYIEIEKSSAANSTVSILLTPDKPPAFLSSIKGYNSKGVPDTLKFENLVLQSFQKGHQAYYIDGDLAACQILETDEVTSNTQNDNASSLNFFNIISLP